ncbi:MAG: M6 family metalloprotease domain-containing protein [Bacteroidaceae bacterium]|nr:M6 family metalloprotease domain-containing protein [Bacteroidaceae bacterium]
MKRIALLLSCLSLVSMLMGVPARRVRFVADQIDGSRIALTLCGDERLHYYLTDDAQPVVCADDGGYYYAKLNVTGILSPSSVLAHEPSERNVVESNYLKARGDSRKLLSGVKRSSRMQRPAPVRNASATRSAFVGTKKGLVILAQFPDCVFTMPDAKDYYQAVLNGNGAPQYGIPSSVSNYFKDQSNGLFDLKFDVVGPVTVSNKVSYYGSNNSWGDDLRPEKMVEEAVRLSSSQVDFSDYDWDNDGYVDQIFVLYAGYSEAQGAAAYTIWPHAYNLSYAGITPPMFNGVKIDAYACSSELSGKSGSTPDGIGTFCHEFSHNLGLPDLYDIDYSGGYGMYIWSLMDAGCYCGPNLCGEVPCNFTGYERWLCGWSDLTELKEGCVIDNMPSVSAYGPTYLVRNRSYADEYYLLENRQQTGWDAYLPAHGLLVMHVDYDRNAWLDNTVNDVRGHQRFVTIPADNTTVQSFNGSMGDLYPGSSGNTSLTDSSIPAATLYHANTDGRKFLGRPVEQITEDAEGRISFVFDGGKGNGINEIATDKASSSAIYNLQGIKTRNTNVPGIYVKNGRKILVR